MMTWVSISGTALAIFLIMAIFMSDRLQDVSISPDSNRQRILVGQGIDFHSGKDSGSGMGIKYELANKLYNNLDGIEKISFVAYMWGKSDVGLPNGKVISAQGLKVDDEFWNLYDYQFLSGKPFYKEEIDSGTDIAILTESVARKIFGSIDVEGQQIDINNIPYKIKGVVKDPYPLLSDGTMEFFINFSPVTINEGFGDGLFGETNTRLLMKDGVKAEYIKNQVKQRYEEATRELEEEGSSLIYHKQPYTSAELSSGSFGSNNDPQLEFKTRLKGLVYVVVLLLPAINLSSMTRSRLRNRISEIGVRRAFGAKRKSIISQIFVENLLMSFVGGAIGLCFSLIFLAFLSGYFIAFTDPYSFAAMTPVSVSPVIWNVFDFSAFFIAFGACFVLNILSATVPAWRASVVNPAIAIAKTR